MGVSLLLVGSANAWVPGAGNESAVTGFSVDTSSREDVLSFYNHVYLKSDEYVARGASNWTGGSVATGQPGTLSSELVADVQRRINFYRAMVGLSSDVRLNDAGDLILPGSGNASTTKADACQEAAVMFAAEGNVSHTPPSSWSFWTAEAANAAANGNLAYGFYGPGAIDAYMEEATAGNEAVGHRRWLMYPRATNMATGDVVSPATNVLYVTHAAAEKASVTPKFHSWPNEGFCPDNLVPMRWSLSYAGADFSSASVSVVDGNGSPVSLNIVSDNAVGYADNSIVWEMAGFPKAVSADESYTVTVSGINGAGIPSSKVYTVTLFDPNTLDAPLAVMGVDEVETPGGSFFFDPVQDASEVELEVSGLAAASWSEGAENGTTAEITDKTGAAYSLFSNGSFVSTPGSFVRSGSKSFRLAFPDVNTPEQSFELDHAILPGAAASLSYYLKKGYMVSSTELRVQVSSDRANWSDVGSVQAGTGIPDGSFGAKTVSLPQQSEPIYVRFLFSRPVTAACYTSSGYPSYAIGAFIDDISVNNCQSLADTVITTYAGNNGVVELDSVTAGGSLQVGDTYQLRVRAKVGSAWMPYSDIKSVDVVVSAAPAASYEAWASAHGVGSASQDTDGDAVANLVEYAFGTEAVNQAEGKGINNLIIENGQAYLRHSYNTSAPDVTIAAECSTDLKTWHPVPVSFNGGVAEASADLSSLPTCFLRWTVVQN